MIIFESKIERAQKFAKEQKAKREGEGHDPENDVEMADMMEKGDMFAMILSALITILPVAVIVLGLLAAAGYFFIVR